MTKTNAMRIIEKEGGIVQGLYMLAKCFLVWRLLRLSARMWTGYIRRL